MLQKEPTENQQWFAAEPMMTQFNNTYAAEVINDLNLLAYYTFFRTPRLVVHAGGVIVWQYKGQCLSRYETTKWRLELLCENTNLWTNSLYISSTLLPLSMPKIEHLYHQHPQYSSFVMTGDHNPDLVNMERSVCSILHI